MDISEKIRKEMEERHKQEELIHQMTPEDATKITLYINLLCYGPEPENGYEIGQRLTVMADGSVTLEHEYYVRGGDNTNSQEEWYIREEAARKIIKKSFNDLLDYIVAPILDIGSWTLTLTFENGLAMNRFGSYGQQPSRYSAYLRRILGRRDLFICKGN